MLRSWRMRVSLAALFLGAGLLWVVAADKAAPATDRAKYMKSFKDGNWKDAYEGLRKLALDPKDDPKLVGEDLTTAVDCLQRLGRVDEIDDFREGVIAAHAKNWRLLETAAVSYTNIEHYGYMVAGKFHRGNHRGGGKWVNAFPRDRVRALQLMTQAMDQTAQETDKPALGQFYMHFAGMLLTGGNGDGRQLHYYEAWRLQYLTDLKTLPDYEEGYYYRGWRGNDSHGAAVDAKGDPIYHTIPKGYEKAESDGERWRYMLMQAIELDNKLINQADLILGDFCRSQYGVQTMAQFGNFGGGDDGKENKSGTFALHTLTDDETIARLATGVKRFKVPDEFNWIKIYQRIAGRGKSDHGASARDNLAHEFEDRRQYVKAAAAWREAIKEYGAGDQQYRQKQLDQIVGNWGRFEPLATQPAGTNATVDFRFRNGNKVSFEAWTINVPKLLDDVQAYLKSNPGGRLDYNQVQLHVQNIGWRLVEQRQNQYIGEKVASWDMDLKPRPAHVDDRVTVTTPLNKPGAYLVTGTMANGNTSRILVWLSDTTIVKKQLDNQALYYIADAVTGAPLPKTKVDFFGWRQVQVAPGKNEFKVVTTEFSETTDAEGQIILGQNKVDSNYSWVVTVKQQPRFAYLGFTHMWFGRTYDPEYNAVKVFTITDRPVYRPNQTVNFKFWVRHAKYDEPDVSDYANRSFIVRIFNPKGEKIVEKSYTTDEFAGLNGEFAVPTGATLGMYRLTLSDDNRIRGGSAFRVEEYKKPEFEVKIEAPKEPVRLGEPVVATIEAKYYFGAPVTKAKVKYKVARTNYSSNWYPRGAWDWFYGAGYWWFAADYNWYPGFAEWAGCHRPYPWWFGPRFDPPEIVLENEVEIGPDGRVQVAIDTLPAKELHGNTDHKYEITAEVVDESRRTIVGTGNVLVARKPFQVFTWLNRGYYRSGDTVEAFFDAHTLDNKPVKGKGVLVLNKISYEGKKNEPTEKTVQTWNIDTDEQGSARQQFKAAEAGQYRLSYRLTDSKGHTIEGAYVFVIRGTAFDGKDFRFNDIELVTDKREYAPGEKVKISINTNKADSTVLLFVRPTSGVYLAPKILRLKGKSIEEEIAVIQKDMPNFFIEALTVADGRVHSEVREVVVPPEKRVLNVQVTPNKFEYKPGEKATVTVKLTDLQGKPFVGSTVVTMYDRSVEYISGGGNVPAIKEFFWKWRRRHNPQTETNVGQWFNNLTRQSETVMSNLGVFGARVVEELAKGGPGGGFGGQGGGAGLEDRMQMRAAAPAAANGMMRDAAAGEGKGEGLADGKRAEAEQQAGQPPAPPPGVEPTVRKNFADTAFWAAALNTNQDGVAEVTVPMPENLTGWKVKVWAMGHGTKVGQAETEVTTKKDLIVRLQAPRFFVQKDEVVLSANVHNYLKVEKNVSVSLEVDGGVLQHMDKPIRQVKIPAGGEQRVDWRVAVVNEGQAIVRMKAISDEDSDAMQMSFPAFVHGMLKTDSYSGVVRPDKESASVTFTVPAERRINESRLEVRFSPTLAGAMVDALPYLVDYPYGCTEQTLNRFVPTVITQRILVNMKLDLKAIEQKRTNLNAQEIGDAKERAKGWQRFGKNPVFSMDEVKNMAQGGVQHLAGMQCSDGGWGWFSGYGERSWPHTTAVVVHGLQIAKANGVGLPNGMLERGVEWLKNYQNEQVQLIKNSQAQGSQPLGFRKKEKADNLDAMVYMVLVDAGSDNAEMRDFLYRDRTNLAVYSLGQFGLALHQTQQADKLKMILQNISQYVVQDDENQTAYLKLPVNNYWWYWYGSENEANAYYLKLLSKTDPKGQVASRLVKYLLNNRKNGTYWSSTRDTAVCIEAMADYMVASGEDKPDMTVEVHLDGKKWKEVKIDSTNLFTFDNSFVLFGDAVESGKHKLELKRKGTGPVYFNAYMTNFTLEDFITKAGLEVKVERKYYKLTRVEKEVKVQGSRGQALNQKVEKYERTLLTNLALLKSGDLVEVELEIESKNDYEYLIFEDMKPAGFEPMLVRSGYNANDMGAYMELRDDRVSFFVRALARGKHSVSYRMRAEIPGKFSALPTRAYAMYAPELRGNSDEIKLRIED